MTTHEMMAAKGLALLGIAAAGASTVAAQMSNSLPIEGGSIIALVGCAFGYGQLRGRIEERAKSDDARYKRLAAGLKRLTATVELIAEKQGIPIAHLKKDFGQEEL